MKKEKIRPASLKPGDEVAIISPSFSIDEDLLQKAVTVLGTWGLKVRLGNNALKRQGPFAGSDDDRLADLNDAVNDRSVKAVFCSRGGYGMSRIIDRADFEELHKNPKWFVGFSDITVLHLWLSRVYGMISLHAEMPVNYSSEKKTPETISSLKSALFGKIPDITWEGKFDLNESARHDVKGELTGGNLSILYAMMGTKAQPETSGKILFIEEVGEYYYHVDRMLTSLRLGGLFDKPAAVIFGGMNRIEDTKAGWNKTIEDTVLDCLGHSNFPVLFGFPAGHISDNRALYMGGDAALSYHGSHAKLSFI